MILEARMAQAYRDGQQAARDRKPWNANPHNGTADSAVERVLAISWRRGYSSQTPELPADLPDQT